MDNMKKLVALLLAVVMVLTLVACGGGSGDSQTTNNDEGQTTAAKDTVILATSGEPYRFFAQSSQSCGGDDNLVLSNVYDCLLLLEADGSLSPALAESYDVSEDGLCYTFHLRQGVKFHNGEEMTAEDVKFTFDLGAAGPIGAALFVNYESSEIVDDYTINMYLSSPYAAFPYGAASRLGGIACKSYYDEVGEEGYMKAPIGTGPYKFVEYVSGSHTKLTANEDYWRGAPEIKNVIIQTVADTNTQILGLQNGDYDVVRNPSLDVCTRLDGVDGVAWNSALSTGRIGLLLPDWAGPGKDLNFRKAVQAAINKDDVNEAVFAGYSETLDIDMCSNYGGYVTEADGVEVVAYDPEAAKAYLADSNYNGEEFAITVTSGTILESCAKVVQAQLMEVGINCTIKAVDNPTYQDAWGTREYQAYINDNLCSLVDADGMYTVHRTDRWDAEHCWARDAEIEELLLAGRAAQGDARTPLYVEASNIITEEAYGVPLVNGLTTVAYSTALTGVEAHCLGNYNFYFWGWAE